MSSQEKELVDQKETVSIKINAVDYDVELGKRLVNAIEDVGVDISHRCGGNGKCTTCRIMNMPGVLHRNDVERSYDRELEGQLPGAEETDIDYIFNLSCQHYVKEGLEVTVLMPVADNEWDEAGPRPADVIPLTEQEEKQEEQEDLEDALKAMEEIESGKVEAIPAEEVFKEDEEEIVESDEKVKQMIASKAYNILADINPRAINPLGDGKDFCIFCISEMKDKDFNFAYSNHINCVWRKAHQIKHGE